MNEKWQALAATAAAPEQDLPSKRGEHLLDVKTDRKRWNCRRPLDDMRILAHSRNQFALSRQTDASPRLHVALNAAKIALGRQRTARVMGATGLNGRLKTRVQCTTATNPGDDPVAAKVLNQGFGCDRPAQEWGAD